MKSKILTAIALLLLLSLTRAADEQPAHKKI